jgi:hypothetical protein
MEPLSLTCESVGLMSDYLPPVPSYWHLWGNNRCASWRLIDFVDADSSGTMTPCDVATWEVWEGETLADTLALHVQGADMGWIVQSGSYGYVGKGLWSVPGEAWTVGSVWVKWSHEDGCHDYGDWYRVTSFTDWNGNGRIDTHDSANLLNEGCGYAFPSVQNIAYKVVMHLGEYQPVSVEGDTWAKTKSRHRE